MGRSIALIILIFGLGFVVFQLMKFFFSINSSSAQRRRDIELLKSQVLELVKQLVPLTNKELELLSINQSIISVKRGLNPVTTGFFTSIYQEPLLAFAYKKYKYPEDNSLICISTATDDFLYISKENVTQVFLNNNELGYIESDGFMYDSKTKKSIAKIEADHVLSSHPVKVGEREVGEIVNVLYNQSPNPRAYQFLEPMDEKEEQIFKALTFLTLVGESI